MKKSETVDFIKNVENKITPEKIAQTYMGAEKLRKLPKFIQKIIINKSIKNSDYMGFVIEPFSFFLAYEINDDMINGILPSNYELISVSLFENNPAKKCAIIGCFNVHTSAFSGARFELYIMAKNKENGMLSWLIYDYESNTIHYDPGKGFLMPTLKKCIYTTSYNGNLICDFESSKSNNKMDFTANLANINCIKLNQQLWVEGNLSIDYCGKLDNKDNQPYGLIFNPDEMKCAQLIKLEDININNIEFGFITSKMKPFEACCFVYAQHFLTTMFPQGHKMKNRKDLNEKIKEILKTD